MWKTSKAPPTFDSKTLKANGKYVIVMRGPDEEPEDDRIACRIERKGPSDGSWQMIADGTDYSPFDGEPYPDDDLPAPAPGTTHTYKYRAAAEYSDSAYNGVSTEVPVTIP